MAQYMLIFVPFFSFLLYYIRLHCLPKLPSHCWLPCQSWYLMWRYTPGQWTNGLLWTQSHRWLCEEGVTLKVQADEVPLSSLNWLLAQRVWACNHWRLNRLPSRQYLMQALSSSSRSFVACLSIILKKMVKRVSVRIQPCFSLLVIGKCSEKSLLHLIWLCWPLCIIARYGYV